MEIPDNVDMLFFFLICETTANETKDNEMNKRFDKFHEIRLTNQFRNSNRPLFPTA